VAPRVRVERNADQDVEMRVEARQAEEAAKVAAVKAKADAVAAKARARAEAETDPAKREQYRQEAARVAADAARAKAEADRITAEMKTRMAAMEPRLADLRARIVEAQKLAQADRASDIKGLSGPDAEGNYTFRVGRSGDARAEGLRALEEIAPQVQAAIAKALADA